jgi:hypothetical protein
MVDSDDETYDPANPAQQESKEFSSARIILVGSLVTLRSTRRATKEQTLTTLTSSAARQPLIDW